MGHAPKKCRICGKWFLTTNARHTKYCDGEWGEISFNFENCTAEIIRLADWDTMKTNKFANEAIRYILSLSPDALKKYMLVPLEPPLIS